LAISQPQPSTADIARRCLTRTSTSHIGLRVGDVDVAVGFYRRVLGLSAHSALAGGGQRMGWGHGHHVVDLLPGKPGLDHFGFAVGNADDLQDVEHAAEEAGYPSRRLAPQEVGIEGFELVDPDGNRVQFHGAVDRSGEVADSAGRRPIRYQHITLATTDVPQMLAFYRDVVGFRQSDVLGDNEFTWLRSNREHHTLAIVAARDGGDIDHYAFDISGWEEIKAWCDRLTEEEVPITWGPGRHGPGNNLFLFFDDPAGHHIELSAELERFHDDRVQYGVRRWEPVPASVNLWGHVPSFRTTSKEG
jgi:catechol 2,3-dioxygenase